MRKACILLMCCTEPRHIGVRCVLSIWEVCIVAVAGFCSGVIKAGVGIGAGVFLLPTLSLAFPAKTALGIGAPLLLVSDILGLRYYWKQWVSAGELFRLLGAALPGLLVGTVLLPVIPAKAFRVGVGIFGVFYAVSMLWPAFPPTVFVKRLFSSLGERHADKQVYLYGFSGGIATVLAHAGGLVWSLYLMTSVKDRRVFVGTICLVFFITNIYKIAAYVLIGTIAVQDILTILPALPAVWLGSMIGNMANKYMRQDIFRNAVLFIIIIVSMKLCF